MKIIKKSLFALFGIISLVGFEKAVAQEKVIKADNYIVYRSGLGNLKRQIRSGKATIAFVGGSITYNDGWRDKVCAYLKESYPATDFVFINAGIPSLGSLPHAFRLKTDLPQIEKVDMMFLESAVNDQVNGTDSLTQLKALEGIVRWAKRSNPDMDILMMEFADPVKNKTYSAGKVPTEIINHELIAQYYRLASINLSKLVIDKINNKEFSWEKDFKDLHPSPFGQELYFETIKTALNNYQSAGVVADKKSGLPKPLNSGNFEYGYYGNINRAKLTKGWNYINNWKPARDIGTRAGFVNVPIIESSEPGATLSYQFSGTAIGINVVSGPDAGMVLYSIDGSPFKKVDLYTEWSNSLYLPWYILFASDLPNKKHVLQIKIASDKNLKSEGKACEILHFLVNGKE